MPHLRVSRLPQAGKPFFFYMSLVPQRLGRAVTAFVDLLISTDPFDYANLAVYHFASLSSVLASELADREGSASLMPRSVADGHEELQADEEEEAIQVDALQRVWTPSRVRSRVPKLFASCPWCPCRIHP